jgi:hypothetical protein
VNKPIALRDMLAHIADFVHCELALAMTQHAHRSSSSASVYSLWYWLRSEGWSSSCAALTIGRDVLSAILTASSVNSEAFLGGQLLHLSRAHYAESSSGFRPCAQRDDRRLWYR